MGNGNREEKQYEKLFLACRKNTGVFITLLLKIPVLKRRLITGVILPHVLKQGNKS
jgi:hypothetical protein